MGRFTDMAALDAHILAVVMKGKYVRIKETLKPLNECAHVAVRLSVFSHFAFRSALATFGGPG